MKSRRNKLRSCLLSTLVFILCLLAAVVVGRIRRIRAEPEFEPLSDALLAACRQFRESTDRQESYDAANAIIDLETTFHGAATKDFLAAFHGVETRNGQAARGKTFHSLASYVEVLGGPDWIVLDDESLLESVLFPRGKRYCWKIHGVATNEFDDPERYFMLLSEDGVSVRHASW